VIDREKKGQGYRFRVSETTGVSAAKKPRVALWIATGCGLGYLPVAPGTWGSLGGVVIAVFLNSFLEGFAFAIAGTFGSLPIWLGFLLLAGWLFFYIGVIAIVGVWASRHAARYFGKSDPGQVVIDEISGQMITYLPLGVVGFERGGWKYLLLGFILFRIFDIVKPPPARQAEKWPHGWGIMADDWFAGIYAAAILWFVQRMHWLG